MKVIGIVWDTYGEDVDLPTEVELPDNMDSSDQDDVMDWLCDKFGHCPDSWDDIVSDDTREICLIYEVTAVHCEHIVVPKNLDNSEVENWLDRNGILDNVRHLTEEEAHNNNFADIDYAITDEFGRDIKPWE